VTGIAGAAVFLRGSINDSVRVSETGLVDSCASVRRAALKLTGDQLTV
jgi:hypothetical protein